MPSGKSKIKREKMDFKKTLFILCVRIDKAIMELKVLNFQGIKQVERGITTLEKKLAHVWDNEDEYEISIKGGTIKKEKEEKKVEGIDNQLKKMKITNMEAGQQYFDLLIEKYGILHKIMDRENFLGEESEEGIEA